MGREDPATDPSCAGCGERLGNALIVTDIDATGRLGHFHQRCAPSISAQAKRLTTTPRSQSTDR